MLEKIPFPPKEIVTTNWDKLLEDAIGQQNYNPIFEDTSVSRYSESKINLYKIHGDLDRDLIITENDYQTYKDTHPLLCNALIAHFQHRTILFIGYSTEDDNFLDMYMEIYSQLGEHNRPRYSVDLSLDSAKRKRLEEKGIQPIEMSAKDFLEELLEKLAQRIKNLRLPSPKAWDIKDVTSSQNPFAVYRAEDIPNVEWTNGTFVRPVDYANIIARGNVILEGHRGSGKSILLQYLSYEAQMKRGEESSYIGIYVKLKPTLVTTTKRRQEDEHAWKDYFLGYINILIGEQLIISIRDANKDGDFLSPDSEKGIVSIIYEDLLLKEKPNSDKLNLMGLLRTFKKIRTSYTRYPRTDLQAIPSSFLSDLVEIVKENTQSWRNKDFYILLDEYDNLDDEQQKVVNLLLRDRGPIYYKVGVKFCEMVYEDLDGKPLEIVDDYEYVPCDRFDSKQGKQHFRNILKHIAQKRLEFYGYKDKVENVFPGEEATRRGYKNSDYSGLDNIALLSSGLVRDFVELCKDMIYYAHPWVLNERRETMGEISPKIQNLVIQIHSNILYTSLHRIKGPKRSKNTLILIDNMGILFFRILKGSRSAEERTVSSFQLRKLQDFTDTARNALRDCVNCRVLQVPYMLRKPQNPSRHTLHSKYEFHRLLCPRFKLSLALRWPKEIDAKDFNQLFSRPTETIDKWSRYFGDDTQGKLFDD